MDELVKLIASLTKSEKRYFKMFTSMQSGEKNYVKLFEAIEKLEEYDEEKIKKVVDAEEFKRLPAVKNYLYGQILKSLRIIYSGDTIDSQLKEMIDEVAILYEKRLYKQCAKILDRAKDLAEKNELILPLIEINGWRERVMMELLSLDKFEKTLEATFEEETRLLKLQKNVTEFRNLYNSMILINKKIKEARTEEELQQFKFILNHPLVQHIDNAKSFEARHYFYLIHLMYNHAKGDNEACLEIAEKQLKLLELFPDKIEEKPKMYISALNNILLCQIHLHNYGKFDETLSKLRNFPVKSLNMEVNRFVSASIFEMVRHLDTGDFNKSVTVRENIISGLAKYNDKINPIEKITLLYNLFYSYFGTGEYQKALGMINKLLNEYQKELRYDIQSAARILNLILHYELRSSMLLEYNAISTYRFLYKSKRLYKMENIVLNFIRRKMPDIYTPQDETLAFIDLRKEVTELQEHPFEKKAFEYFDYISWLDSKIEKSPFEDVVKRKFQDKINRQAL
jgi:hypothetical protein